MVVYQQHDHHADTCFGWNTVTITTTTHDAGDIVTDKDIRLARDLNQIQQSS